MLASLPFECWCGGPRCKPPSPVVCSMPSCQHPSVPDVRFSNKLKLWVGNAQSMSSTKHFTKVASGLAMDAHAACARRVQSSVRGGLCVIEFDSV